jgi:uncharacterized protein (TIGR03435 family)
MHDASDMDLLRQYAVGNSDAAFAALVSRHINLVYSAALRKTGNPHAAEEITQAVFIILAQKAGRILDKTILPGWLYQTARLTASSYLRRETRRTRREQEAFMQSESHTVAPNETWEQLAPLLEDAMGQLGDKDRAAVVLRFFSGKSFAEVATAAGVSENAAKKRVIHALEKLHRYFSKRGVSSTTEIIAGAISANSVQVAPVALAKAVTAVAIAKGAAASGSTLTLIKGALKIMAWTKAKTVIVGSAVVLLAAGTTTVTLKEIEAHKNYVWQKNWDLTALERVPPQVKILPALSMPGRIEGMGERNNGALGLGVSATAIVQEAYGVSLGRLIFSTPVPLGKYDFIFNLPSGQREAMQQEIRKKFGLVGRRELIETNVLVLTLRHRQATGLRSVSAPDNQMFSDRDSRTGSYSCHQMPISNLAAFIEDYLQVPVVDRTGLAGRFDIDIKGDSTPDGLKQVIQDELGLELVPSRESIEMLVVEKVK